jgi:DNA-binding HxlR family transcriptional regulator
MKGYGQFCPIAVACETFAERWTPLILREVLFGSRRFNEIRRGVSLISRTLLAQRLRELEDAGILESRPLARGRGREYHPTRAAEEFGDVLERLGEWGQATWRGCPTAASWSASTSAPSRPAAAASARAG